MEREIKIKVKKWLVVFLIVGGLALFGCSQASAEESSETEKSNLSQGEGIKEEVDSLAENKIVNLERIFENFYPYISLEESFNDNIFLTSTDEEADFVTTIVPGIKYKRGFTYKGKTYLLLDGGGELKQFSHNDDVNSQNPYGNFYLRHNFSRHILKAHYNLRRYQRAVSEVDTSAEGSLIDYWITNYGLNISRKFNRLTGELEYRQARYLYEKDYKASNSHRNDVFLAKVYWKFLPKTSLLFEYDYGTFDYHKGGTQGNDYDQFWLGIEGQISPKIEGLIKFGYEDKEHDSGDDTEEATVQIDLDYKASSLLKYHLMVKRATEDSTFGDIDTVDVNEVSLSCEYFPPFSRKLILRASAFFGDYDYESNREDEKYGASLGFDHSLTNWLKFSGGYEFAKKASTSSNSEYENNIIFLKLASQF